MEKKLISLLYKKYLKNTIISIISFVLFILAVNNYLLIKKSVFWIELKSETSNNAEQQIILYFHERASNKQASYYPHFYVHANRFIKTLPNDNQFHRIEFSLPAKRIDKILFIAGEPNKSVTIKQAGLEIGERKSLLSGDDLHKAFYPFHFVKDYQLTDGMTVVASEDQSASIECKEVFNREFISLQEGNSKIFLYLLAAVLSIGIFLFSISRVFIRITNKIKSFIQLDWIIFLLFVTANTLKITIFNSAIVFWNFGINNYIFKFIMVFAICFLVYHFIFRKSKILLTMFFSVQFIYIIVNLSYFLYFNRILYVDYFLLMFDEGFGAVTDAGIPIFKEQLFAFIDIPFFLLALIFVNSKNIWLKRKKLTYTFAVSVIILMNFYHIMNGYSLRIIEGRLYFFNKYRGVNTYVLDRSFTVEKIIKGAGLLTLQLTNVIKNEDFSKNIEYSNIKISSQGADKKFSVIAVQMESVDSNIIGMKHNGNLIAPFLTSLSENNVFYPYCMSYHLGGATSDSEIAVLNSVHPLVRYAVIKLQKYAYPNSIVHQFSKNNFESYAFHGNVGTYFNRKFAFSEMGFDEFFDIKKMKLKEEGGWGAADKDVFTYILDKVGNQKNPYYYHVITMSSHAPFYGVKYFFESSEYEDVNDKWTRDFFYSMKYIDMSLEYFITELRKKSPDSYIFLYGDHCPRVNTSYYKEASFVFDDKLFEFVPLIIITPDNKKYKENKFAVSFMDVGVTMLDVSNSKYELLSNGTGLMNYPIKNGTIDNRGSLLDRSFLYNRISKEKLK